MRKTLVYYNPKLDEIWTRVEDKNVCYSEYADSNIVPYLLMWDEHCEKNFILIGEL